MEPSPADASSVRVPADLLAGDSVTVEAPGATRVFDSQGNTWVDRGSYWAAELISPLTPGVDVITIVP